MEQKNDEKRVKGKNQKRAKKKRQTSKIEIKGDMDELEYHQEQFDFDLSNHSVVKMHFKFCGPPN